MGRKEDWGDEELRKSEESRNGSRKFGRLLAITVPADLGNNKRNFKNLGQTTLNQLSPILIPQ